MEKPPPADFPSRELPLDRELQRGAERLQVAVATLPLRYAPFFGRLAELWQLSELQVIGELERAREPQSWRRTLLGGLRQFEVRGSSPGDGPRARLLSFEPGLTFPQHRHQGTERVLVLEGRYADDSGEQVGPGEEQTMAAGSEHRLHILGDVRCMAAVSERGVSFVAPWLERLLRPLLR